MATMAPQWWGLAHFVAVLALAASLLLRRSRVTALATHLWPVILVGWWWIAFIVRWITDDKTTIVNVGNWGFILCMLIWSAALSDDKKL